MGSRKSSEHGGRERPWRRCGNQRQDAGRAFLLRFPVKRVSLNGHIMLCPYGFNKLGARLAGGDDAAINRGGAKFEILETDCGERRVHFRD